MDAEEQRYHLIMGHVLSKDGAPPFMFQRVSALIDWIVDHVGNGRFKTSGSERWRFPFRTESGAATAVTFEACGEVEVYCLPGHPMDQASSWVGMTAAEELESLERTVEIDRAFAEAKIRNGEAQIARLRKAIEEQ